MKNLKVILVAVLVLVLVWFLLQKDDSQSVVEENNEEMVAEDAVHTDTSSLVGSGSLSQFLGNDQNVKCDYKSVSSDGAVIEGFFMSADGKMSVESRTRIDGNLHTSNMINDGQRTYMWGGTAEGLMAIVYENKDLPSADASAVQTTPTQKSPADFNLEENVDYDCQKWTPEANAFTPPAGIDFINMADVMGGMFNGELRGVPEGMDF